MTERISDYEYAISEYYCNHFKRTCYNDGCCSECSDLDEEKEDEE